MTEPKLNASVVQSLGKPWAGLAAVSRQVVPQSPATLAAVCGVASGAGPQQGVAAAGRGEDASIEGALERIGLDQLENPLPGDRLEELMSELVRVARSAPPLRRVALAEEAVKRLRSAGVARAGA